MSEPGKTKWVVSDIILALLLIGALSFGLWAFSSRQDYKNNVDKKIAAAVESAKAAQKKELDQKYAEDSKNPHKTYNGPLTYGKITFEYPKTWSGYVDDNNSSEPINAYFYPDILPYLQGKTAFALRIELLAQDYSEVVSNLKSDIDQGNIKAAAYTPPKMKDNSAAQPGLYVTGKITQDFTGSMVILKVRDKTLEISTQSKDFQTDFDNTVLATLTFAP